MAEKSNDWLHFSYTLQRSNEEKRSDFLLRRLDFLLRVLTALTAIAGLLRFFYHAFNVDDSDLKSECIAT